MTGLAAMRWRLPTIVLLLLVVLLLPAPAPARSTHSHAQGHNAKHGENHSRIKSDPRVGMPPDSHRHPASDGSWVDAGPAGPGNAVRLTFALRQNPAGLAELRRAFEHATDHRGGYAPGRLLSREEITALVRPAPETFAAVEAFLLRHGVGHYRLAGNEDYLVVDTSAKTAAAML
eukprot:CAMPEP_0118863812 /NCGR_PEP_ID=MMETSP1163-20130328/8556_1 /TAXON_ID=124430 /ORGANISM="Phaeomonas parva, Strain CCMP2877" /LENGTH=174 /DNA_ID=CAMNT_0006797853 /DNA_START=308 /DNA_END=829 /DNA_ORIENTATION=-